MTKKFSYDYTNRRYTHKSSRLIYHSRRKHAIVDRYYDLFKELNGVYVMNSHHAETEYLRDFKKLLKELGINEYHEFNIRCYRLTNHELMTHITKNLNQDLFSNDKIKVKKTLDLLNKLNIKYDLKTI